MYACLVLASSQEMCKKAIWLNICPSSISETVLCPQPPSPSRALIKDLGQSAVYRCWKWVEEADAVLIKHTHTRTCTMPSEWRSLLLQGLTGDRGPSLGVHSHDKCWACAAERTNSRKTVLFFIVCVCVCVSVRVCVCVHACWTQNDGVK